MTDATAVTPSTPPSLSVRGPRPRPHPLRVAKLLDRAHWPLVMGPLAPDVVPAWRAALRRRHPDGAPPAERGAVRALIGLIDQQATRRAQRSGLGDQNTLWPADLEALQVQAPWLVPADLHPCVHFDPAPAEARPSTNHPLPVDQLPDWGEVYVYIDDTGSDFTAGARGGAAGALVAVLSARPLPSPAGADGTAHMVEETEARCLDWLDALAAMPVGVLGLRGTGSWESTLTALLRVIFAALAARAAGPPARVHVAIEQAREHRAAPAHALWAHAFSGAPPKGATLKVCSKGEDLGLGWADVLAYGWQRHAQLKLCLPRTLLSGLCPLPGPAVDALVRLLDAPGQIDAVGLAALAQSAAGAEDPGARVGGEAGGLRADPLRRLVYARLEQACADLQPGVWDALLHVADDLLVGSQLGLRAQRGLAALLERLAAHPGPAQARSIQRRAQRLAARVRRRTGAVVPGPYQVGPRLDALQVVDPDEAAQEALEAWTGALWSGEVEAVEAACGRGFPGVNSVNHGRLLSLWGQAAAFGGAPALAWERLTAAEAALQRAGAGAADLHQTRAYALHAGLDLHPRPIDWLDRAAVHLSLPVDRSAWGAALCDRAAQPGEAARFDRWLVCKAARARAWPDLDPRALLEALLEGVSACDMHAEQPIDGTWPITLLHAIFALGRAARGQVSAQAVAALAAAAAGPTLTPRGRWRARAAAALAVHAGLGAHAALHEAGAHGALVAAWRDAALAPRWRPPAPGRRLSAAQWRQQVVPFLWV